MPRIDFRVISVVIWASTFVRETPKGGYGGVVRDPVCILYCSPCGHFLIPIPTFLGIPTLADPSRQDCRSMFLPRFAGLKQLPLRRTVLTLRPTARTARNLKFQPDAGVAPETNYRSLERSGCHQNGSSPQNKFLRILHQRGSTTLS